MPRRAYLRSVTVVSTDHDTAKHDNYLPPRCMATQGDVILCYASREKLSRQG